jgi:hypothetical protein
MSQCQRTSLWYACRHLEWKWSSAAATAPATSPWQVGESEAQRTTIWLDVFHSKVSIFNPIPLPTATTSAWMAESCCNKSALVFCVHKQHWMSTAVGVLNLPPHAWPLNTFGRGPSPHPLPIFSSTTITFSSSTALRWTPERQRKRQCTRTHAHTHTRERERGG